MNSKLNRNAKRILGALVGVALAAALAIATLVEPRGSAAGGAAPALVYVSSHGKKYHGQECRLLSGLRASEITSMKREDAEAAGYTACRNPRCFPK